MCEVELVMKAIVTEKAFHSFRVQKLYSTRVASHSIRFNRLSSRSRCLNDDNRGISYPILLQQTLAIVGTDLDLDFFHSGALDGLCL